ncbi:MAG TPA: 16S rRNA (uracil(1498)-N(3))-methyltransferase [Candidatus Moranbacteria bacterium]|nr:16S rRNA (uracil(1498)-N(3))-methyltransferase [Candidatus Moranbacteria bacterium]
MSRFFVSKENIGEFIKITGDDVLHIGKVLRMREGDALTVCDGDRADYECKILEITKKEVICSIVSKHENTSEPSAEIILFQGIPKGAKMELVIQKCVEIGVTRIVPFISERTVAKSLGKNERWKKIAEEAAKQSGRGIIPVVEAPVSFEHAISRLLEFDLPILAYEEEKNVYLKDVLRGKTPKKIGILIGPEGGLDAGEAELARKKGVFVVTLGKRILRTETAGMVVISNIIYEYNL